MPTIAPLPAKPICLSCKKSESPGLMGSTYEGQGENGMRVPGVSFIRVVRR